MKDTLARSVSEEALRKSRRSANCSDEKMNVAVRSLANALGLCGTPSRKS